jgi:hypothetical protein
MPPTDGSAIVEINDTACYACTVNFDIADLTIAELRLLSDQRTGATFVIQAGNHLTITSKFVLGSQAPAGNTAYWYSPAVLFQDGMLTFGKDVKATFWFGGTSTSYFYNPTDYGGHFTNKGTITVKTNIGVSAGNTYYIGYQNAQIFQIDNWGTWVVEDPIVFRVQNAWWNEYGGAFNSTNYDTDASPTITFYDTEFYLQDGSDSTQWNGPTQFYSYYSQYTDSATSNYVASVVVNTTGVAIAWTEFSGVNVVFNYDAWVWNSNFTSNACVNTTNVATTTVTLGGATWLTGNAIFSGYNGALRVHIDKDAWFFHSSSFYLFGGVEFINSGTFYSDKGSNIYSQAKSMMYNLGLVDVVSSYILWSSCNFPDGTAQNIGSIVNRGTVQSTGGYVSFARSKGAEFIQCSDGVIKLQFGSDHPSSTSWYFAGLQVDGYLGILFQKGYTLSTYESLFSWDSSLYQDKTFKGLFVGSITEFTKGPGIVPTPQQICSGSGGYAYIYQLLKGTCSAQAGSTYSVLVNPSPLGGVCKDVPKDIMDMDAPGKAANNVGIDTGAPAGKGPNSASSISFSLALLVSFIGFLFYY